MVEAETGSLSDLDNSRRFDAILYVDVLEHIEDDGAEAAYALSKLAPGGHLIVMAPAHDWLFSELDRAAGHFRRYTKGTLSRLPVGRAEPVVSRYLDCVGVAASLANRVLLGRGIPNRRQILVWDRIMVPISRVLDPLLLYGAGKSVLMVWRSPQGAVAEGQVQ